MIDPRLAAWQRDPARRTRTRDVRAALLDWWTAREPLASLGIALDRLGDPATEEVAASVWPLLLDAAWLDGAVARFARAAIRDPLLDPPLVPLRSATHDGVLLFQHRHVAIFAGVGARERLAAKRMRPRGGVIVVPGQLGLIRVLSSGGASLSLWRGGWCRGAPMSHAEPIGTRRLVDGETIAIDGRDTGFVIEHASGDIALLQATILARTAPTLCEYDAATLELAGTGAAREDASRAQLLVSLLASLDLPEREAFDPASRRPEPYARWHAMRAWTVMDAAAAAPRLAEMAAGDPDVELRGLAAHTLGIVAASCRA